MLEGVLVSFFSSLNIIIMEGMEIRRLKGGFFGLKIICQMMRGF